MRHSIHLYSETLLYRRAKYALLFCAFIALSLATVVIILWVFPSSLFMSATSALVYILDLFHSAVNDEYVTNEHVPIFLLRASNFITKHAWINYYIIVCIFFISIALWRIFILKTIGGFYVWILKMKDSARFASGGNARFAGLFEDYNAKGDKGIYLGRSLFSPTWHMYDNEDRHMLTIAGSRSGKGASCIIPNLLEWQDSVLCIDPKATNYNVSHRARKEKNVKTLAIDPFNVSSTAQKACFNPLSIIDPQSLTAVEDVRIISDALITKEADGKNEHFTEGAKMLLDGYIVHVVTSGDYDNPSLLDVYNIIHMTSQEAIDIHAHMMANKSCGGMAHQAANRILETMASNEYKSVVATLKTNLKWLSSEAFKETLSRSDFSFDEMKDTRMSVFLIIPPDLLVTHKRFLRLFVNVAISRYTRGGKAKIKGLFIIDECPALGYMEEIIKAYGELASYNLIMWAFFQDKGQLDKLYGERGQTFIGSSRAVQVFGIDDSDAEWVAGMIGTRGSETTADNTYANTITAFRDAGSIRREIGAKGDMQYILRSGSPALLLQRTPYFKSFRFQKLARPDPDYPNIVSPELIIDFLVQLPLNFVYWIFILPYIVIINFIPKFIKNCLEGFTDQTLEENIKEIYYTTDLSHDPRGFKIPEKGILNYITYILRIMYFCLEYIFMFGFISIFTFIPASFAAVGLTLFLISAIIGFG